MTSLAEILIHSTQIVQERCPREARQEQEIRIAVSEFHKKRFGAPRRGCRNGSIRLRKMIK
jgi:hypothetical protein